MLIGFYIRTSLWIISEKNYDIKIEKKKVELVTNGDNVAKKKKSYITSSTIKNSSFISADLREANFSNSVLENVDFKYAWFKDTILKRVILKKPLNLDEATIKSINIGTLEEPIILKEEQAVQWIVNNINK